jgi:hypothetical protein
MYGDPLSIPLAISNTTLASLVIIANSRGFILFARDLKCLNSLKEFQCLVECMFKCKIISMQIDWGGEYKHLNSFFHSIGIAHLVSCPHAKRSRRTKTQTHCWNGSSLTHQCLHAPQIMGSSLPHSHPSHKPYSHKAPSVWHASLSPSWCHTGLLQLSRLTTTFYAFYDKCTMTVEVFIMN